MANAPAGILSTTDISILRLWSVAEARFLTAKVAQDKIAEEATLPLLIKTHAGDMVPSRYIGIMSRSTTLMPRFLNDLALADSGRGFWRFDRDRAASPIVLAEGLPNIKGLFAGLPITLLPWQRWCTANLIGFVDRRTRLRRFRQASIWVPRQLQNTWLAPMAL